VLYTVEFVGKVESLYLYVCVRVCISGAWVCVAVGVIWLYGEES